MRYVSIDLVTDSFNTEHRRCSLLTTGRQLVRNEKLCKGHLNKTVLHNSNYYWLPYSKALISQMQHLICSVSVIHAVVIKIGSSLLCVQILCENEHLLGRNKLRWAVYLVKSVKAMFTYRTAEVSHMLICHKVTFTISWSLKYILGLCTFCIWQGRGTYWTLDEWWPQVRGWEGKPVSMLKAAFIYFLLCGMYVLVCMNKKNFWRTMNDWRTEWMTTLLMSCTFKQAFTHAFQQKANTRNRCRAVIWATLLLSVRFSKKQQHKT